MKNEQGFDKIRFQRWSVTEEDLFFYAVKLFKKDYRAISFLMCTRDLRPIRSSIQKKVKTYKELENSKDPTKAKRA